MSAVRFAGIVTVASLLLAGCVKVPPIHYYVLDLPRTGEQGTDPDELNRPGLRIGVEAFRVRSPYDGDRIVYRLGEDSLEVGFYAYHRWASPLPEMMADLVAKGLENTRGIALIEPVMPDRAYTAFLDGRLLALEEVDTAEGQVARLLVSMTLRLEDGTRIWSETLEARSVTKAGKVESVVGQMSVALAEMLSEGRANLERRLRELPVDTE